MSSNIGGQRPNFYLTGILATGMPPSLSPVRHIVRKFPGQKTLKAFQAVAVDDVSVFQKLRSPDLSLARVTCYYFILRIYG